MIRLTRRATLLGLAAIPLLAARTPNANHSGSITALLDASLSPTDLPVGFASRMRSAMRLEPELVSQWRASLRDVLRSRGGNVVALVRWDKALILSGLVREERRRVTSTRLSQSVFQIEFEV
jgi:hypothetical protein